MAKTEVILIQNVIGLGGESDQVKVSAGYARNYLLPQHLAVPLNGANKRRIEVLRQRRAEREANELNAMTELSKSVTKLLCVITVKTGDDGKMFGAVTTGQIADELKRQFDLTLEKRKIHLEKPIKTLGEHEIELRLHPEVKSSLKLRVESSTPLPVAPEAAPAAEGKDGRVRESRGHRVARDGAKPEAAAPAAEAKADKPERKPRAAKAEKA
ncbi:MAG: 50S ribosomal protein L9 [Verrucomicrobia bacterium]|nr:50S ribosomal protein L9 [Verrucomicrobiota bacterium]